MAYCNECGAYIPDGRTKCLACGYDAAEAERQAEQAHQTQQAYEYKGPKQVDTDFLREQLEKQRKRQQENTRKWAETEKAQRERARQSGYSSTRSTDAKKYAAPDAISGSKLFSALSYFGILFALPYFFCKEDDFALFHAKQGMILFIAGLVAKIAGSIFGLGWLANLLKIYFIYKGVSNSLQGIKEKLPYIGSLI